MTPEQIAENVKRLREIQNKQMDLMHSYEIYRQVRSDNFKDCIETINALVQLVGELYDPADAKQESDALAKAAPIAALAKESV